MAEIPPFLEVPGVPGGRVAMSTLSPELQQSLMSQYGPGNPTQEAIAAAQAGGFHIPTSAPEPERRSPFLNPRMTDNQQATLGDIGPETGLSYGSDITPQQAASLNSVRRPLQVGEAPPATQSPAISPADAQAFASEQRQFSPAGNPSPPGGPTGGPMGMVTTMAKGSLPSQGYGGGGLGGAFDKAARAQAEANAVAVRQAEAQAEGEKRRAELLEQQANQAQEKEAKRQELVGESRKAIESAQKELQTPDGKVDANRLWANKSTGQKVLAGIAVVLTGLGQGLMGRGGNPALDMIQKQIDDDINIQREAIAAERSRKKDNFSATVQRHDMLREQLGDERAVEHAEQAMRWNAAEQMLRSKLSLLSGDEAKARGAQLLADIGLKKAEAIDAAGKWSAQFKLQALETAAKLSGGGKPPPQLPAGEAGKIGELDAALGMLQQVGEAHGKLGSGSSFTQWIGGTKSAQYRDQMKVATQVIGGILEGGKLTDKDYDRYLGMMPKAGDFSETAMNKVRSIAALLQQKRDSTLAAQAAAGFDTSRFPQSGAQKRSKYGAVEH